MGSETKRVRPLGSSRVRPLVLLCLVVPSLMVIKALVLRVSRGAGGALARDEGARASRYCSAPLDGAEGVQPERDAELVAVTLTIRHGSRSAIQAPPGLGGPNNYSCALSPTTRAALDAWEGRAGASSPLITTKRPGDARGCTAVLYISL